MFILNSKHTVVVTLRYSTKFLLLHFVPSLCTFNITQNWLALRWYNMAHGIYPNHYLILRFLQWKASHHSYSFPLQDYNFIKDSNSMKKKNSFCNIEYKSQGIWLGGRTFLPIHFFQKFFFPKPFFPIYFFSKNYYSKHFFSQTQKFIIQIIKFK